MGQSLVKNYTHITFSTKNRLHLIHPPYENELHNYIGGICKNLECYPAAIGGHTDHIHILCLLSKKIALIKLLEEVKSSSSKWMKTKNESLKFFYWQDGYGSFSVNTREIDSVFSYITNQHEHHKRVTFQDEYRAFLKRYKVDYDEKYVWD